MPKEIERYEDLWHWVDRSWRRAVQASLMLVQKIPVRVCLGCGALMTGDHYTRTLAEDYEHEHEARPYCGHCNKWRHWAFPWDPGSRIGTWNQERTDSSWLRSHLAMDLQVKVAMEMDDACPVFDWPGGSLAFPCGDAIEDTAGLLPERCLCLEALCLTR